MTVDTGTREHALRQGKALLLEDAKLALEQARVMLEVDAHDPDAHRLAATALRKLGRLEEAGKAEHQALLAWQATPALRSAAQALSTSQNHEAEKLLRDRLAVAPEDGSAKMMLADIAVRTGFVDEAEELLREVLDAAPAFAPAREELATLLSDQARFTEALEHYESLLASNPSHRILQQHRITVLTNLGRYDEAMELIVPLLDQNPDDKSALLAKGNIEKTIGNADSEATYRRITARDAGFGEAWWSIANLKNVTFSDDDIRRMEDQLKLDLPSKSRINLLFALGTAKEKSREYAQAFEYYSQGNSEWLAQHSYSADFISERVDETVEFIDSDWFESFADGGCQSETPIFIVGMPRAGSTLTEQILTSHSAIEGTAELPYIPVMSRKVGYRRNVDDAPAVRTLSQIEEDRRLALGEKYLQQADLHRNEHLPHFIDKTPNNWLFIPLIRAILPNAKIIDVRRDAMACCFSNFKQHFARGQMFTYSLEDVGRYYRDYVRQMDHIDKVAPGYVHRICYEDLVSEPESEIRSMLDNIGLEFEESCLKFYENKRAVRTASAEQVRRPLDSSTNEAWKHFSEWLDPLREALGDLATPG